MDSCSLYCSRYGRHVASVIKIFRYFIKCTFAPAYFGHCIFKIYCSNYRYCLHKYIYQTELQVFKLFGSYLILISEIPGNYNQFPFRQYTIDILMYTHHIDVKIDTTYSPLNEFHIPVVYLYRYGNFFY